eukprot:1146333-Pelagomonas_calceolata.AAC.2
MKCLLCSAALMLTNNPYSLFQNALHKLVSADRVIHGGRAGLLIVRCWAPGLLTRALGNYICLGLHRVRGHPAKVHGKQSLVARKA